MTKREAVKFTKLIKGMYKEISLQALADLTGVPLKAVIYTALGDKESREEILKKQKCEFIKRV